MNDTKLERELQELDATFAEWEKTEKERMNQHNQINQQSNLQITYAQDIILFMYYISLRLLVNKCERNIKRKINTEEFFIIFFIHLQFVSFLLHSIL